MSDPDSFSWGDTSFAVPRPGAGRKGAAGEPTGQETIVAKPPATPPAGGPGAALPAPPVPPTVGIGFTPLVQAATPLLVLIGQLRGVQSVPNIPALRELCRQHIGRYEQRALASGVDPRVVQAARYVLCASLDEAVLATLWGAQSEWMQHTLLMELHRERFGGENFFVMLDRFSKDPEQYGDMVELQYLCLALGFTGRYHGSEQNIARLRQVRGATFNLVRDRRDAPPQELSLRWRGLEDRRNRLVRYVPWGVIAAATLAIVAVTFSLLSYWLRQQTTPVQVTLAGLGKITSTRPSAILTLKQLLAPEEAAGVLSITENGNETTIIPEVVNLFASGKVDINPSYVSTLRRIAAALNRVPGRVLITGHTDNQPIRSGVFADNFELSRERAVTVARFLQTDLGDPSRVTSQGLADTAPRARPPSQPENRERNRRVEIVHVP